MKRSDEDVVNEMQEFLRQNVNKLKSAKARKLVYAALCALDNDKEGMIQSLDAANDK